MPQNGFVFAATGAEYIRLAIRAAKSLKLHCPDDPIDLYSDVTVDDPVFAQVHTLNNSWHRPKMESLYRSRFDRTVYLDADLLVIADISDIFEVLEAFDFAAAQDSDRNGPLATTMYQRKIPAAFPQFNGGVMGVSKNKKTDAFLRNWEHLVEQTNAPRDQPILRELLFDSDLRLATLPPEYNYYDIQKLRGLTHMDGAPRILHHFWFIQHLKSTHPSVETVEELIGEKLSAHVDLLIQADRALNPGNEPMIVAAYCDLHSDSRINNPFAPEPKNRLMEKLRHPFRGTYGEIWLNAVKRLWASLRAP